MGILGIDSMRNRVFGAALRSVLIFTFSILWASAPIAAAPVTNPANGHTYEAVEGMQNWAEAKAAAEAMSHTPLRCYLATITSQAENDFIVNNTGVGDEAWLGGLQKNPNCPPDPNDPNDLANDPSLWGKWITGEPWDYTNWFSDEPDDCPEECLLLEEGAWGNEECDDDDPPGEYIVECEPADTAPTVSSVGLVALAAILSITAGFRLRRRRA